MKSPLFLLNSDALILDLIRKREDGEALAMLYNANRRAVTSYVLKNSGTSDDAEDLLQDALIVLWEKVRSGNFHYESKLSTFVMATVKNMWLRRLARGRKEVPGAEAVDRYPADDPSPLEDLMESESAAAVQQAMQKIGDPCRTLLLLFYWEERSLVEIAAEMGFANADTVKSKKYQCKKALENLLPKMS